MHQHTVHDWTVHVKSMENTVWQQCDALRCTGILCMIVRCMLSQQRTECATTTVRRDAPGNCADWILRIKSIGELPKLCVKIRPDSWLVCGPFHCHRRWQRNGPQTNQLSGRIFTHNLGNSPIPENNTRAFFVNTDKKFILQPNYIKSIFSSQQQWQNSY